MEMYLIPQPAALFWAMLLLMGSGAIGFLCARRLRWGAVLGLALVALASWHLLPPLIPPASIPARDRAEYWHAGPRS